MGDITKGILQWRICIPRFIAVFEPLAMA